MLRALRPPHHAPLTGERACAVRTVLTRAAAALLGISAACDLDTDTKCEEDPAAQIIVERIELSVYDAAPTDEANGEPTAPISVLHAELADEQVERERGWRHRVCDREALLMVQATPAPIGIWGCGLVAPISVAFIRDHEVIQAIDALEPCDASCLSCPIVGGELVVDAVLELDLQVTPLQIGHYVEYEP